MEWLWRNFNDAFCILIDGVPISLLPDATNIISANSVSKETNRHLYIDNDIQEHVPAELSPPGLVENSRTEYDGLTVKLKFHAMIGPGSIHRVRIVICDTLDARLDSALFIKNASMRAIEPTP